MSPPRRDTREMCTFVADPSRDRGPARVEAVHAATPPHATSRHAAWQAGEPERDTARVEQYDIRLRGRSSKGKQMVRDFGSILDRRRNQWP